MKNDSNPGNFEDRYHIADVGYRVIANLIDLFVFWLLGIIMGMYFGTPSEGEFGYQLSGLPALALMAIGFFLWPISEGLYGQTLGKRVMNLKVVNEKRKPIGIGQGFGRFFFAFVDLIFFIGIFIAIVDKNNQRLGDQIARTLVVRSK